MSKKVRDVTAPVAPVAPIAPIGVPIQRTELSTFDDSFSFLREKFIAEMQRMEEEINKFSSNLMTLYGVQGSSAQPGQASGGQNAWDALASSPLIQGEGNDKMIKLQFDMSEFDPSDIRVEVDNEKLVVWAKHEHKTPNSELMKEIRKEFILPHGINTNTVISSLSRDGVLTVEAPLPQLVPPPEVKAISKNPEDLKKSPKSPETKRKIPEDTEMAKAPAALTNQVPQSPMSTVSPASPLLTTNPTSPTILSPHKTSKTSSRITKPTK